MTRPAAINSLVLAALVLVVPARPSAEGQASGAAGVRPLALEVTAPRLFEQGRKRFASIVPARPASGKPQDRADVAPAQPDMKPRVICGMTVIPVSPAIDSGMVVTPKATDANVTYAIRRIKPAVCADK